MLSDLHLCFDDGWGRCKSCWCYHFLLTMHKLGTLPIPPEQLDILSQLCVSLRMRSLVPYTIWPLPFVPSLLP
jgi:hypothetical protein